MASINKYKSFKKADIVNTDGGYKNVILFSPVEAFTAIQVPAGSTTLGAKKTVATAHTFPTDEGFMSLLSKLHSVTVTGQSEGDEGAQSMVWTGKGIILGDSAMLQDELEDMLNDNLVFLLKDADCLNSTNYIQFGDSCLTPTVKLSFDGKTSKEGLKEYGIEFSIKGHKYFYTSTVTMKA